MMIDVRLNVSFPHFGRNYFTQNVVMNAPTPMIMDQRFDAFLMPAAGRHFNNGVVGFNDQFRFLSDVLEAHLAQNASTGMGTADPQPAQRQWA